MSAEPNPVDPKTLEKEIFGDSDDSEHELSDISISDDEEAENDKQKLLEDDTPTYLTLDKLPSFKKRQVFDLSEKSSILKKKKPKKLQDDEFPEDEGDDGAVRKRAKADRKKKASRQSDEVIDEDAVDEKDLTPEQRKAREAANDIEAALNRIKPKKAKRDLIEETDIDEMIQILIAKMEEASQTDIELNEQKAPAIAKLKLLPIVEEQLSKRQYGENFLDNGILKAIRFWLEPCRPDGQLPVLDIQKAMFRALESFQIDTIHLRESGVGRVVHFYSKFSEIPEIKKMSTQLVDKWMRPIINRSDKYKDRRIVTMDYDLGDYRSNFQVPREDELNKEARKPTQSTFIENRARIPMSKAANFDVAPRSMISGSHESSRANDPYKRLKNKMMMMKRKASGKAPGGE